MLGKGIVYKGIYKQAGIIINLRFLYIWHIQLCCILNEILKEDLLMRWSYYKYQFIIYSVYTTVLYIEGDF